MRKDDFVKLLEPFPDDAEIYFVIEDTYRQRALAEELFSGDVKISIRSGNRIRIKLQGDVDI